jgi:hypothetical protein
LVGIFATSFSSSSAYNNEYSGHFSWINSQTNHHCLDYDKKPVLVNGKEVTVMEWLVAQRYNMKKARRTKSDGLFI